MGNPNLYRGFDTEKDVPDQSGKVILITGGTSGLGKASVQCLARHKPQRIYFTGRDSSKAKAIIAEIKSTTPDANISFIEMDHGSLNSVQKAAKTILEAERQLDTLIACAGIMGVPPSVTSDGYEVQFGTNHIAHALLIQKLLPLILKSADGRVVIVTSLGATYAALIPGGIAFDSIKTDQASISRVLPQWVRYGQSKLANRLYILALARRYPSLIVAAIHPGSVRTEIITTRSSMSQRLIGFFNFVLREEILTPEQGIASQLWAVSADKAKIRSGAFYEPVGKPGRSFKYEADEELANKLYDWTESELAKWKK